MGDAGGKTFTSHRESSGLEVSRVFTRSWSPDQQAEGGLTGREKAHPKTPLGITVFQDAEASTFAVLLDA
eukprot:1790886-Amphidinium_carterae.1